MKKAFTNKIKKIPKSSPISHKLFFAMIALSALQIGTFFGVLSISGEFSYIKRYSYNLFIEKTENRKNYVETMLTAKMSPVYDTANEITHKVDVLLEQKGFSAANISTDKQLNKEVISISAEVLIDLLRRDSVNDAYIILDSGDMYDSGDSEKNTGFYIRDTDTQTNNQLDQEDILVEMGSSDIASQLDLALDYEWAAHLDMSGKNGEDLSFYTDTVETARANPDIPLYSLGCWSGFSRISNSSQQSLKYTLPLISSDGVVYGVVGIGLMEKSVLSAIPSNDFFNESACYILGADFSSEGQYSVLTHSGAVFNRIVDENTVINDNEKISAELYDFNKNSDIDSIGCIKPMKLYNSGSPYNRQQWALISIGDRESILNIYITILRTLFLSTIIAAVLCFVMAIMLNRKITAPVTAIIKLLNDRNDSGEIIRFSPSGLLEFDRLASSITELQISVKQQASKVSRIISMADIGIGVFMLNLRNNTVFMGETLIKILNLDNMPHEDTVVEFEEFEKYISLIDDKAAVIRSGVFENDASAEGDTAVIETVSKASGRWFMFKLMRSEHHVTGLVQDITNSVIEKKKIEYERDHDITTGLLNRRAYFNKISELFAKPKKLKTAAFIMLDMDNLKYVNDTYGHDFGDDYIKTTANVFKMFREYGGIVSRLSGDEFNVFLYGYNSKDEIRRIVETVREKMSESYCILADGTHFKLRASGGVSWYPDDSRSYEQLIKYSDFAMYTIKHSTKGKLAEFDMKAYNKDSILITGVEEMNRIIDEERVKYAFHTIISAKTGEIYGYEALMRPQSDIFKTPLEFIRIAKTGAKLYEIERLTWFNALRTFRSLAERGIADKKSKIFINSLSDCLMGDEDIKLLEQENKDFLDRIVLEILESEQVNDKFMKAKRRLVAKWHAKTALDDFGCGYNNEFALITLEPDLIKIDRSIISGCDSDISRRSIISSLVEHARLHRITVLAEGVETYNEMKTVIECGVDLIQGYYVCRPLYEPQPVDPRIVREICELQGK